MTLPETSRLLKSFWVSLRSIFCGKQTPFLFQHFRFSFMLRSFNIYVSKSKYASASSETAPEDCIVYKIMASNLVRDEILASSSFIVPYFDKFETLCEQHHSLIEGLCSSKSLPNWVEAIMFQNFFFQYRCLSTNMFQFLKIRVINAVFDTPFSILEFFAALNYRQVLFVWLQLYFITRILRRIELLHIFFQNLIVCSHFSLKSVTRMHWATLNKLIKRFIEFNRSPVRSILLQSQIIQGRFESDANARKDVFINGNSVEWNESF